MQKFDTEMGSRRRPYLRDHAFRGMVVLPGTSYVSLALDAAGEGLNTIRDLEFEQDEENERKAAEKARVPDGQA